MNRIDLTPVVKNILICCLVLFIGTLLLQGRNVDLKAILAMHFPNTAMFRPWQIISHMFMHGNFAHIAFNMFALVSFGVTMERIMGSKKFLQLFFFSGLGAIILHIGIQAIQVYNTTGMWFPSMSQIGLRINNDLIHSDGTIIKTQEALDKVGPVYFQSILGASGSIYGVVVAFAFLFPNTELMFLFIPFPIKAKFLVPIFLGLDVYLGFANYDWDPVAHFAHVGGALTGLILVYVWRRFDKTNFW